jgi:hypothetical protein
MSVARISILWCFTDAFPLGLFPAHERPIYNYIRRSESHYLKKKRTHLLTLARDILTSDDRNTIAVCPLAMFGKL